MPFASEITLAWESWSCRTSYICRI